jgi:hypothetical protein
LGVRHKVVLEDLAHNPVEETVQPIKANYFEPFEEAGSSP